LRGIVVDSGIGWVNLGGAVVHAHDFLGYTSGTNETPALQAAIDSLVNLGGGRVLLGARDWRLETTLKVASGAAFNGVCLVGDSRQTTLLSWYGSTSGTAVLFNGSKNSPVAQDFQVINRVARGTTIGMHFSRESGTGTQNSGNLCVEVSSSSFYTGWRFGDNANTRAASEIVLISCGAYTNTYGWVTEEADTLDIMWLNPQGGENGSAWSLGSGCFQIIGGSCSGSTVADIECATYMLTVIGLRSEGANRYLKWVTTGNNTTLNLRDCLVTAGTNADGIMIEGGNTGTLRLDGCDIYGRIAVTPAAANARVTLKDTRVMDSQLIYPNQTGCVLDVLGNCRTISSIGAPVSIIAPGRYVSSGTTLVPGFTWDSTSPFLPVIATASLPAAGAANDGRCVIEDNGTGDRNLVFYAGGQRFRVDGGASI